MTYKNLRTLLEDQHNKRRLEIIQTDLSEKKIEKFIQEFKEIYSNANKLSSLFEIINESFSKNDDDFLGWFSEPILRENFIKNGNSSFVLTSNSYPQTLIKEENALIIDYLKDKISCETISLEDLAKNKIPEFKYKEDYYFFTNLDLASTLGSWQEPNDEISSYKTMKYFEIEKISEDKSCEIKLTENRDFEFALFLKKENLRIEYFLKEKNGDSHYEYNDICKKIYIKFEDWSDQSNNAPSKPKDHIGLQIYSPRPRIEIINKEEIKFFLIEE